MNFPQKKGPLPLAIALVFFATIAAWSPALGTFYFSEDFIHSNIAWQALHTHREILTQYLTAPFFQCSNMGLFYRPLIELSFVCDAIIYGGAVWGSHLTNILCHALSSVLCLLIVRKLTLTYIAGSDQANSAITPATTTTESLFSTSTATLTGTVAGLLFGLNPLQGETIYWLICRCDGFCTMFSLLCLYLAMIGRGPKTTAPAVVALSLAIFSKEQAFMVPLLLGFYFFISDRKKVFARTMPYAATLVLTLVIRWLVLGGIGGYHGTIGVRMNESSLLRIFSPIAWNKIFYPLDQNSLTAAPWAGLIYSLVYLTMAVGLCVSWRRGVFDNTTKKLIAALLACAAVVLLPLAQTFFIVESLYGARNAYMFQAFIAMALAIFLFQLRPLILRNILIAAYVLLLSCSNVANSEAWTARSRTMRALGAGINQWAQKAAPRQGLCLLNVPLDERELSSFYDLEQIRCFLKPPANTADISDRAVQTSYMRMSSDCINKSRLKWLLQSGDVDFACSSVALGNPFKLIDRQALLQNFQPIDSKINFFNVEKPPETRSNTSTQAIELDLKNTAVPQQADYIEVITSPRDKPAQNLIDTKSLPPTERATPIFHFPSGRTIFVLWYTDLTVIYPDINWSTAKFIEDGKQRRYIFPVADRITWKCAGSVRKLILGDLPNGYKVDRIRLRDESSLVPEIALADLNLDAASAAQYRADGMVPVNDKQSAKINFDSRAVEGAVGTILEISAPDFFPTDYVDSFRDFEESKNRSSRKTLPLSDSVSLNRSDFPSPGKYQVRVAGHDHAGQVVGYFSDPVEIVVTAAPFADAFERAVFNLRAQPAR